MIKAKEIQWEKSDGKYPNGVGWFYWTGSVALLESVCLIRLTSDSDMYDCEILLSGCHNNNGFGPLTEAKAWCQNQLNEFIQSIAEQA